MTNKYENMTYLLAIKEMQTEMRHHFPPMRMTKTKTRRVSKRFGRGLFIHYW